MTTLGPRVDLPSSSRRAGPLGFVPVPHELEMVGAEPSPAVVDDAGQPSAAGADPDRLGTDSHACGGLAGV